MHYIIKFLITFIVFMGIDLLWLGFVARKLYVYYLGPFLRTPPNWPVAFLFYCLFIVGLIVYAIEPAIIAKDVKKALFSGAMFGFFTYMTPAAARVALFSRSRSSLMLRFRGTSVGRRERARRASSTRFSVKKGLGSSGSFSTWPALSCRFNSLSVS